MKIGNEKSCDQIFSWARSLNGLLIGHNFMTQSFTDRLIENSSIADFSFSNIFS